MMGRAYSITLVHTYIRPAPYVRKMAARMYEKWFPGDIFWIHRCIGFIFHTQVYNHKIQVKFDNGRNPLIIIRVMAFDLGTKNGFRAISFEYIGELDSYFIQRYIIIKYRSSSITDKTHRLLSELWPFVKWQCPIYSILAIAGESVSHYWRNFFSL